MIIPEELRITLKHPYDWFVKDQKFRKDMTAEELESYGENTKEDR